MPRSFSSTLCCPRWLTFALQICVKVVLGLFAIVVIIAAVIGVVVGAQHHGQSTAAALTSSSSLVTTSQPTLYVLCRSVVQYVVLYSDGGFCPLGKQPDVDRALLLESSGKQSSGPVGVLFHLLGLEPNCKTRAFVWMHLMYLVVRRQLYGSLLL